MIIYIYSIDAVRQNERTFTLLCVNNITNNTNIHSYFDLHF